LYFSIALIGSLATKLLASFNSSDVVMNGFFGESHFYALKSSSIAKKTYFSNANLSVKLVMLIMLAEQLCIRTGLVLIWQKLLSRTVSNSASSNTENLLYSLPRIGTVLSISTVKSVLADSDMV
jgi:hypothetical protein